MIPKTKKHNQHPSTTNKELAEPRLKSDSSSLTWDFWRPRARGDWVMGYQWIKTIAVCGESM
jgi:hypothetical protein